MLKALLSNDNPSSQKASTKLIKKKKKKKKKNTVLLLTLKLLNQGFLAGYHFIKFTVAIMTWLTVMEYQCHIWPQICSICRSHNPVLFSSFMTYHQIFNQ